MVDFVGLQRLAQRRWKLKGDFQIFELGIWPKKNKKNSDNKVGDNGFELWLLIQNTIIVLDFFFH
jgi:hypothetical protein